MKTLEELRKIKERAKKELEMREGKYQVKVTVGMGTCGIAAGAKETMAAIIDEINKRNIKSVMVTQSGCAGFCDKEPIVEVEMEGLPKVTYGHVDAEVARMIVSKHIMNGQILSDYVILTEEK